MKKNFMSLLFAIGFLASSWASADTLIKTCEFTMPTMGGDSKPFTEVYLVMESANGKIYANKFHKGDSSQNEANASVKVSRHPVRSGLTSRIDRASLNEGEKRVLSAMEAQDEIFEGLFDVGFSLNRVRSVTLYEIPYPSIDFFPAIVDALDGSGQRLGSYFDIGSVVARCKL